MLAGSMAYGEGVDVWACACLAAEMCSGRPLFPGQDEGELVSYTCRRQVMMICLNYLWCDHVLPDICRTDHDTVGVKRTYHVLPALL